MSELINNSRKRRDILKKLIYQLHDGAPFETVQREFAEHFSDVSASEISQLEQELVQEGMPVAEIQRLCDVHASVFKGSIEDIHKPTDPSEIPGHPVMVFQWENREIEQIIEQKINPLLDQLTGGSDLVKNLHDSLERLRSIDRHYSRKENLLFPYLERYGITAPPKVMWGVDDEIRTSLKNVIAQWDHLDSASIKNIKETLKTVLEKIREMIFKEEKILFPLALEKLKPEDWIRIVEESPEIGYCLIEAEDVPIWPKEDLASADKPDAEKENSESLESPEGRLDFPTGALHLEEITQIFNTLPVDITFVDAEDTVRYFSQGPDRIFARTKTVIGRKVAACHPPASVAIVEKILADFKEGKRDKAEFWIHMGPRFVLIRYYAVRSEAGSYLGTLEVTQDIAPLRALEGEKRLLDEK